MQRKQDESLKEIRFILSEMNQVKSDLIETNEFKPNLTLLNQEEGTSLFGSIKLDVYRLNSLKSKILTNEQQYVELIQLCAFSLNDRWSLLYRGTRDGFGSDDYHSRCDDHSNILTILKAKESFHVFGGFTTVNWDSSSKFKTDPKAFIFSLTNKDNIPLKIKIEPNRPHCAIYCNIEYGPTFGADIYVANNANTTMGSYSDLSHTYTHPQYAHEKNEAQTFLSGAYNFQLAEIEVYQREI
jgi:hypothetical protein